MFKERTFFWQIIACAFSFFYISQGLYSQTNSLKKNLLIEYEPAAKKLGDFYSNMKMSGKFIRWPSKEEFIFEYMANGNLLRMEEKQISIGEKQISNRIPGTKIISVANKKQSFMLEKKPTINAFQVLHLWNSDGYEKAKDDIRRSLIPAFAPYCYYTLTLLDILTHNDWEEVISINNGKRIKKIKLKWREENDAIQRYSWFIFYPDDSWALKEYSHFATGIADAEGCQVEYINKINDIPLVNKVEYWRVDNNGVKHKKIYCEVIEIIPGPVPEKEFTLAEFGLPDIVPVEEKYRARFYYLLIGGLLLVVLGLFFRYLDKRRKSF